MTAWAMSPGYGASIALGPTQRAVLDLAMELTRAGRRPELTLGELARMAGRPVSSVHDALGRLRALGLLGVSARMGRTGGHRLWRVTTPAMRPLDVGKHRRAIARIVARWSVRVVRSIQAVLDLNAGTVRDQARRVDDSPGIRTPGESSPTGETPDGGGTVGRPLDPFGVTPLVPKGRPETFREKLDRYGLGAWIDHREDAK